MFAILTHTPFWVWPLFLLLIWLGLRATKDRESSVWMVYLLPLLGLITLSRALALPQGNQALMGFVVIYLVGAAVAFTLLRRWVQARNGSTLSLRGEWLTMVAILGVFLTNFAAAVVGGRWPDTHATPGFALGYGLVAGFFAGIFMGRALRAALWRAPAQG